MRWINVSPCHLHLDGHIVEPGGTFTGTPPRTWIRSGAVRPAKKKKRTKR